jgi:hypothetical protein
MIDRDFNRLADGTSEFPVPHEYDERDVMGHSLRDHFAGRAMQAIVSVLHNGIRPQDVCKMAEDAYLIADEMLKARRK